MPAPQFQANTARFDPYKNYRFKVKWDGTYVAGVSKVGLLKRSTEVVKHRMGDDPSGVRVAPGQSTYDPVTLEQGVTHDVAFQQWANKAWNYHNAIGTDPDVSLKDFRKDITIEPVQRSRTEGSQLQRIPLLGFGIPSLAGARRRGQRHRHSNARTAE